MQKRNESIVLVLSLVITVLLIAAGGWWLANSSLNPFANSGSSAPSVSNPGEQRDDRTTPIISMTVSPDGRTLITGSYGSQITLWDLETRSRNNLNQHLGRVNSLVLASGRLVSGSGDGSARVWDLASAYEVQQPLVAGARVLSLAAANNGWVAAGYSDGTIRIWDIIQGTLVASFAAHNDQVSSLQFAGDSGLLVSGSHDGQIYLWDVSRPENPQQVHQLTVGSKVTSLDWRAEDNLLVSGDYSGQVRFWDMATGEEEQGRSHPGHTFIVGDVQFSPDGTLLASTGYDETVRLWDMTTSQEREQINLSDQKAGFLFAAAFIPTDEALVLAIAGYDGQVRLWNLATGDLEIL